MIATAARASLAERLRVETRAEHDAIELALDWERRAASAERLPRKCWTSSRTARRFLRKQLSVQPLLYTATTLRPSCRNTPVNLGPNEWIGEAVELLRPLLKKRTT